MQPVDEATWSAKDLMFRHPVRWEHPNKALVQSIAMPPGCEHAGSVRVRRWSATPPASIGRAPTGGLSAIEGPFAYDDAHPAAWYPNFADPDLFGYWDGALLAQDELQVLEHPVLAAVRMAMLSEGRSTATIDRDGRPTPITVEGAERRAAVDVMPHPDRPAGLYGNRFARAPASEVRAATRAVVPPTTSRLVAMAAPVGGRGPYTTTQIDWVLTAAHTAFAAAVACSAPQPVRLHAGFWGCGAFGGNRVLMALAQLLAASAAGVPEVVFHTFSGGDRDDLARAVEHAERLEPRAKDDPTAWVIAIASLGLHWGVSDGN